ncbi:MAG: class I mannose-6-phosphate isomerase [Candidatus Solibacter usitatus]|nr:class I mannose-6-phosphate isomerase [Candidatus Solibacter usitatus]
MAPRRMDPAFREKVWGSTGLSPWFPNPETKIGEVWFDGGDRLPLIKFLFTTDRLSVQVHPDDEYAREHENSNGKTEMWHILQASPAGRVAIGFRGAASEEEVRAAALNGTVEGMLNWIPVRPGDTLFVAAGTVHAIGAGIALCEIQQRSDVTYRIYDYGRPRELHLDKALAIANLGPCTGRATLPVRCPFFHTERLTLREELTVNPVASHSAIIALQGEGLLGGEPFFAGEVWEVPPDTSVSLRGSASLLRVFIP